MTSTIAQRLRPGTRHAGPMLLLGMLLCFPVAPGAAQLDELAALADSLLEASAHALADSATTLGLHLARVDSAADSLTVAEWVLRRGQLYLDLRQYSLAESLLQHAGAIEAAAGNARAAQLLLIHRARFSAAYNSGDLEAATAWTERGRELAEELYGAADHRAAPDLANQALVEVRRDNPQAAQALLDQAIALIEEQAGPAQAELVGIFQSRAVLARRAGRLEEAAGFYARSVAMAELHLRPDHPELIHPLTGLGILRRQQGRFAAAESLLTRSLNIGIVAFGADHPRLAQLYNNLGVLLHAVGDYAGAERAFRRCLTLIEGNPDANPAHVAHTSANLASALDGLGRYAASIRLQRRSVAALEATYGPDHSRTASAVSRLADMLRRRGSPQEAEELYRRCLESTQRSYGRDHPDAASYRLRIGGCLRDRGRTAEAETYIAEAIDIDTAVLGADNYQVAIDQREMGLLLLYEGRTSEADSVLEQCRQSLERELGPDHPGMIYCLGGLAAAQLDQGRLAQARTHAERVKAVARGSTGASHFAISACHLLALAAEAAQGHPFEAAASGGAAARAALQALDETFQVSSEHEAMLYAGRPRRAVAALVGLLDTYPEITRADSILSESFSLTTRIHGQVLTRLAQRRRQLELATDSTAAGRLYSEYLQAAQRLANLVVRGPHADGAQFAREVARARAQREEAERSLADASERFRRSADRLQREKLLSPAVVAGLMQPGQQLVQFVRYPRLSVSPGAWRTGGATPENGYLPTGPDRYGAFHLVAGSSGAWRLRFVPLGTAAEIDSLVEGYRQSITAASAALRPSPRVEADYRHAARALHACIWQPIFGAGDPPGARAVPPATFLIPAAALHQIDFYGLLAANGSLVIETHRVHLLSAIADLFAGVEPAPEPGCGILAVGDPALHDERPATPQLIGGAGPSFSACIDDLAALEPLPRAASEARRAAELFAAQTAEPHLVLIGPAATETAVKRAASGKRIIHVAAHGFFCETSAEAGGALILSPLLRSGLVLAPSAGTDDGLLTAQELVARDLRGVEWVLLSACNSGLGRLLPGEGLSGLRRAFRIAGARTVLMALWAIPDAAASELVEQIYRYRLDGQTTLDALRLAGLERLQAGRRRFGRIHPVYWGGIVAEGDWR